MITGSPFPAGGDAMQAAIADALAAARPTTPSGGAPTPPVAGSPEIGGADPTSMGMPALDPALAAFRPGASAEAVADGGSTLMMRGPVMPPSAPQRRSPSTGPGEAGTSGSKTLFGMQAAEMQLGLAEAMAATGPPISKPAPAMESGGAAPARVRTRAPISRPGVPRGPRSRPGMSPATPRRAGENNFDSAAFHNASAPPPRGEDRGSPYASDTPRKGVAALNSDQGRARGSASGVDTPLPAGPGELFRAEKAPASRQPITPAAPESVTPERRPSVSELRARGASVRLRDRDSGLLRGGQAAAGACLLLATFVPGAQAFWFSPELGVHVMADIVPALLGVVCLALAGPRRVPLWERAGVGGLALFSAMLLGLQLGGAPFSAGPLATASYLLVMVGCVVAFLVGVQSIREADGDTADEGAR